MRARALARGDDLDHVVRCRWVFGETHPADGEATEAAFFGSGSLPPMSSGHAERVALALADPDRARLG